MAHGGRKMGRELKQSLFLEERQLVVADLYMVKGKTQLEVAEELGVSVATVRNDIKKIRYEYSMKRMEKLDMQRKIENLKLDAIEKEAWAAWQRSIGKSRRTVTRKDGGGDVIDETITEDELVGDPRFLTTIQSCMDRRIRLNGLDQPQELIISTMEQKLKAGIIEGRITFDMLINEVGKDAARRYFNMAGVEVPDIIDGDYVEDEDVLSIPEVVENMDD